MSAQRNPSIATSPAPGLRLPALSNLSLRNGALLIAGLALLVYLPALNGEFILDDDAYLINNRLIAAPDGWYRFWITNQPTMDYYPVSNVSLWIEWRLWGLHPIGYHATNLLLHIASAILLWRILQRLAIPGAFLAAVLFTIHPVNVESVAWIAQRKGLLAIAFFLLSVWWYLKAEEGRGTQAAEKSSRGEVEVGRVTRLGVWYWLSVLAFALALLSKSSVGFLPLVLLGLTWWQRWRITRADFAATAPYFLVAIVLLGVNLWRQTEGFTAAIRSASFGERLAGAGAAVWFYLSKALLPINLVFVYPPWRINVHDLLWWLPLGAVVIATLLLWRQHDSRSSSYGRSLLFAWGFFCLALVPVLGFVDVGFMRYSLVADHYAHVALIGVVTLVAAGFAYWQTMGRQTVRMAPPIVAVVVVAGLSVLTWQQASLYGGPVRLYSTTLEKNPNCAMAHYNLGNELFHSNQPRDAVRHYELAVQIDPNYSDAHANLGAALVQIGRPADAVDHYQRALEINPKSSDTLANMALAYAALQRPADATAAAEKAVQLARAQGDTALAEQVEGWLKSYRAAP